MFVGCRKFFFLSYLLLFPPSGQRCYASIQIVNIIRGSKKKLHFDLINSGHSQQDMEPSRRHSSAHKANEAVGHKGEGAFLFVL